jgi:hypothetical protein
MVIQEPSMDLSFREFGAMAIEACTIFLAVFAGSIEMIAFLPTGTMHSEADPWSEKKIIALVID